MSKSKSSFSQPLISTDGVNHTELAKRSYAPKLFGKQPTNAKFTSLHSPDVLGVVVHRCSTTSFLRRRAMLRRGSVLEDLPGFGRLLRHLPRDDEASRRRRGGEKGSVWDAQRALFGRLTHETQHRVTELVLLRGKCWHWFGERTGCMVDTRTSRKDNLRQLNAM